jgi:hypothetical protein
MLNEEIVWAGYANLLTMPPNVKHVERFRKAYREAREGRGGSDGRLTLTRSPMFVKTEIL